MFDAASANEDLGGEIKRQNFSFCTDVFSLMMTGESMSKRPVLGITAVIFSP